MLHIGRTLAVAGAALVAAVAPGAQAQYYKGRTITLIVGFSPGGGVDTAARVVAQYLGKYIDGHPNVIVKNLTGGASIKAHNFVFEKARGDGETIFFGPWFPVSQITKSPGIRFKYEDYTLLGAVRAAGNILYARANLLPGGSKDPASIVKLDKIKLAGSHPTNSLDIHARLGLELVGVKYEYVRGYRGSAKIRAAVLNGEVDAGMDSIRGYLGAIVPAMVKTGKAIPIWTFPTRDDKGDYVENPSSPGVPSVLKVYRQVHGKDPSGDRWEGLKFVIRMYGTASHMYLGPPKMNAAAAAAFTKGLYATFEDADYHAAAVKRFKLVPAAVSIETARALMASLANLDPKIRDFMIAHVKSGLK